MFYFVFFPRRRKHEQNVGIHVLIPVLYEKCMTNRLSTCRHDPESTIYTLYKTLTSSAQLARQRATSMAPLMYDPA